MSTIFDFIDYANYPKQWEVDKSKMNKQIDRHKRLSEFFTNGIKSNFKDFVIEKLVIERYAYHKENVTHFEFKYIIHKREINYEFNFPYKYEYMKSKSIGKYLSMNHDYKAISKYKLNFINLISDINYIIGCTETLIDNTDLIVKKLNGWSINPNFKTIEEANYISKLIIDKENEVKREYEETQEDAKFKDCKDKVLKNHTEYPLLLRYHFDYIMNEILPVKLLYPRKIRKIDVFRYIADLILQSETYEPKNQRQKRDKKFNATERVRNYYNTKIINKNNSLK